MSQQPRSVFSYVAAFLRGSDSVYRERSIPAIVRLLVLVGLFYGIGAALINFWPAWRSGYHAYFRTVGNSAFEQFLVWPHASVRFLDMNSRTILDDIRAAAPPLTLPDKFAVPHRDHKMDTLMLLKSVHPDKPGLGQFRTSSRLIAYWPMVTVFSLALAMPWGLHRKLWLLFWSFLAVHLFVVFRLAISVLQGGFADPGKSFRLFDMSGWWFDKLKRLDTVLNDNVTFSYVGGVIVWLAVVIAMELWPIVRHKISATWRGSRRGGDPQSRRQTFAEMEASGRTFRRKR